MRKTSQAVKKMKPTQANSGFSGSAGLGSARVPGCLAVLWQSRAQSRTNGHSRSCLGLGRNCCFFPSEILTLPRARRALRAGAAPGRVDCRDGMALLGLACPGLACRRLIHQKRPELHHLWTWISHPSFPSRLPLFLPFHSLLGLFVPKKDES